MPIEPVDLGDAGEPATVEGVAGEWRVALPVLHKDRLVGKVDAAADRKRSVLQVHALHEDVRFSRPIARAVSELEALASWLGLSAVEMPGA